MRVVADQGVTTDAGAPAIVQPAFAAGTVIAGRYRLESRLGAGGGGTVWRCFDEKLGAVVAFKIVGADVDVERWRREVSMARRIADRNVCRVYDLGETPELRYVTMELVEGTSLRAKIGPDLPAAEARELWRQIVSGTAAIHAAGVVHRDLKPENIVVETSGRAVIVDFGLAREPKSNNVTRNERGGAAAPPSATVTNLGVVVGTPRYMSPEQAVGETVDTRTDVWALGLIGHELLTGVVPPLDEEHGGRRIGAVGKWPQAEDVLRRCVALLPKHRPADAKALLAALPGAPATSRAGARIAIAIAAAALATGAVLGIRPLVANNDEPATTPTPPTASRPPSTPSKTGLATYMQILKPGDKEWPRQTPLSVAIAPDASRFAFTNAIGELHVRTIGGEMTRWMIPGVEKPPLTEGKPPRFAPTLVTSWVAGWFDPTSLALVGMTAAREWQLYRIHEDGRHELLYKDAAQFPVAVSPATKEPVIAKQKQALHWVQSPAYQPPIAAIGNGERVRALAISPDGSQIASIREPADARGAMSLHVTAANGKATKAIWTGAPESLAPEFLVWLDDDRIAFAERDEEKSRIAVHELRAAKTTPRTDWSADVVAGGAAANGLVLVLRGSAAWSVQLAGKYGEPIGQHVPKGSRAHAHRLAGWTADGKVVFAMGTPGRERIVRAAPDAENADEWPNTSEGVEVPNAVVGNDVIAHRRDRDKKQVVIEHIDAAGKHTVLQTLPEMDVDTFVRCAGETTTPCVLERIDGEQATWTLFDPLKNTLGEQIYAQPARDPRTRSVALTADGKTLAIVDGDDEIQLVDVATKTAQKPIAARDASGFRSVAFAPNNDLWTASFAHEGRLFGLAKHSWDEKRGSVFAGGNEMDDQDWLMVWFDRPTPGPNEKLALVMREFHLDISRLDGL
jgi:serine/threonine protein kinase